MKTGRFLTAALAAAVLAGAGYGLQAGSPKPGPKTTKVPSGAHVLTRSNEGAGGEATILLCPGGIYHTAQSREANDERPLPGMKRASYAGVTYDTGRWHLNNRGLRLERKKRCAFGEYIPISGPGEKFARCVTISGADDPEDNLELGKLEALRKGVDNAFGSFGQYRAAKKPPAACKPGFAVTNARGAKALLHEMARL